ECRGFTFLDAIVSAPLISPVVGAGVVIAQARGARFIPRIAMEMETVVTGAVVLGAMVLAMILAIVVVMVVAAVVLGAEFVHADIVRVQFVGFGGCLLQFRRQDRLVLDRGQEGIRGLVRPPTP